MPSQERLREILDYNPKTGILTWKYRPNGYGPWNAQFPGKEALMNQDRKGYRRGAVDGANYQAHRIIYKWLHNEEPDQIDHLNGVTSDNRASNLCASDSAHNRRNQKLRADNKSGANGVFITPKGRFLAYVTVGRERRYLGTYDTVHEASAARERINSFLGFTRRHGKPIHG